MRAEINTGKDRFAAFENQYRIDVIKKKRLIEKSIFFAQPYSLFQKSNQKGEREGDKKKKILYIITYIREKTLPSINSRRLGPINSRCCTFTSHYLQEAMDPICFQHMCGVNQFWIIVFFTAVKPANNILFCIELIQRPESSLRRHKLGLTDQSIRSNDDKTRFTCVHRLMTTGHSQNIWRKVPDDAVLHIWQLKFGCSFILNLL